jgi:hypothetical protein
MGGTCGAAWEGQGEQCPPAEPLPGDSSPLQSSPDFLPKFRRH